MSAAAIIAANVFGSLASFPVWWYTRGALRMAGKCFGLVREQARDYGVNVWIKNLFVPMFGQRDIWGKLISFWLRSTMIIFYSFLLLMLSLAMLAAMAAWLALPAAAVLVFLGQIIGLLRA
ncbi:hypothetical protein HY633_04575 [Candidatus Uhrbacteria bacterium]|nr:hypothetical protein [Candidatus Uhrbacteria bacterium]